MKNKEMKLKTSIMAEKIRSILLIAIGILAIVFAFKIGNLYSGAWVGSETYGGDAYTGIQNASANAANNAYAAAYILQQGFKRCFIIVGLVLASIGGTSLFKVSETKPQAINTPAEEKSQTENSDCVNAE